MGESGLDGGKVLGMGVLGLVEARVWEVVRRIDREMGCFLF